MDWFGWLVYAILVGTLWSGVFRAGPVVRPPCAVRLCSDGRSVKLLCGIQTVDRQARQSCQLHATQTDAEKQASRLSAERCRVPALDTATERPFVLTLKTLNSTVAATKGCSAKSLGANFKKKNILFICRRQRVVYLSFHAFTGWAQQQEPCFQQPGW